MTSKKIINEIHTLYLKTMVAMPTLEHCITPLSELISQCYGLTCKEVDKLTSQNAIGHLLKGGGLVNVPDAVEVSREPLAGYLYSTPNFGCIFVEQSDLIVRRRFTIAHELGHFLLHRPLLVRFDNEVEQFFIESLKLGEQASSLNDDVDEMPLGQVTHNLPASVHGVMPTFDEMEKEANEFAADLLMPELVVRALIESYVPHFLDDDLVWRLATDMLVSRTAMRIRLQYLKLLPPLTSQLN